MRGSRLTSTYGSLAGNCPAVDVDGREIEGALWLVVGTTLALDVVTTGLGLSLGLTEGNPVMRRAFDAVGFVALGAAKLLVVAAAGALRALRPRYGTAIALGLALPWTVTVLVNAVVLTTV